MKDRSVGGTKHVGPLRAWGGGRSRLGASTQKMPADKLAILDTPRNPGGWGTAHSS